MSTHNTFNGLSLFSGIGGIDLAFNWAGGNILAFCEIDAFCQQVLHKHWPNVPIFSDVHEINKGAFENAGLSTAADIIYGGFPCQPFSVAGNKNGTKDSRYLWPEFSRIVSEFMPRWVVAENVPGIIRIAADTVCTDLERQGYSVGIWDYEAASVGAKHRRERIFFVAHSNSARLSGSEQSREIQRENGEGTAAVPEQSGSSLSPDTYSQCVQGLRAECEQEQEFAGLGSENAPNTAGSRQPQSIPDRLRETQPAVRLLCAGERLSQSELDRTPYGFAPELDSSISPTAKGIPNRVKRIKALGNAVVPQQIYPIFKAITECDNYEFD